MGDIDCSNPGLCTPQLGSSNYFYQVLFGQNLKEAGRKLFTNCHLLQTLLAPYELRPTFKAPFRIAADNKFCAVFLDFS